MAEKYLLFSLEDEKSKKLGEVISNPTCKKIVNLLAEKELSEQDISLQLKLPLNTTEYNLKKLIEAGIVEKTTSWFWSVRGKKIPTYKIANKLIVISPKKTFLSKIQGILPAILISGVATFLVKMYADSQVVIERASDVLQAPAMTAGLKMAEEAPNLIIPGNPATYFALGAVLAIVLIIAFNWKNIF